MDPRQLEDIYRLNKVKALINEAIDYAIDDIYDGRKPREYTDEVYDKIEEAYQAIFRAKHPDDHYQL